MVNKNRLVEDFMKMCRIYSPSLNEREMADYLISELKNLGLEVIEDNAGKICGGNAGNIIGVLRGEGEALMFSAHMDTVVPCKGVEPVIIDGKIKTAGDTILGGDDKAGVAAIMEMLKIIKEKNIKHPDIVVVFSIAEEIRLLGAKNFDNTKFNVKRGFILDSSGKPGTVVKQAPYHDEVILIFKGRAAHAGIEPEKGINALYVASKAISKLEIGRIDKETTFNLGKVSGGLATNIVMEKVEIVGEARSYKEENLIKTVEKAIKTCEEEVKKIEGATFEYKIQREYNGFEFADDNDLIKIVEKVSNDLGLYFEAHSLGGGSDANVYIEKGIDTLNLGIGMSEVHSINEYIEIKDLVDVTKILLGIVGEA